MNTRDILFFLKIAETKSFSLAAESMFISQSVVSYTIKKLESSLGVKLFERNSHEVNLTPAGKCFYEDMTRLHAQWNASLKRLQALDAKKSTFRIGTISMTLERDFARIVSNFIKQMPQLQPEIQVCPIEDPSRPLRMGEIDAAFMFSDTVGAYPELRSLPLARIPLYCVVHRTHRLAKRDTVTLQDFRGETLAAFPYEISRTVNALMQMSQRISALRLSDIEYVRASDLDYCLSFVRQNMAITFAPVYLPTLQPQEPFVYIPLVDPPVILDICIAWRAGEGDRPVKDLVYTAKEYFSGMD